METYTSWDQVPEHLKTKTALRKLGLKPKRGQQPAAVKTHWHYKTPDYHLFDMREAIPIVVTEAQKAAAARGRAASLAKRTCTRCGFVEELGRHYRGKAYVEGGLCPHCREEDEHRADQQAAVEWARQMLQRDDVLILDTETTDLDGEVIELAFINLKGDVVYNQRFNPLLAISPDAQAVHGLTADMLASEPRFADCKFDVFAPLIIAGRVLIYNAAFDVACLRYTCKLHGLDMPNLKTECLMEWYAQYVNDWSDYHKSYRWQSLDGDHSALGDCRAALAVLKEMATEAINHE